jgi:hypothetical protein
MISNYLRWHIKKQMDCQALVVQAYNLSYSGGRDQEDCGSNCDLKKKGLVEWLTV